MLRRTMIVAAATTALLLGSVGQAAALDCFNASRPAPAVIGPAIFEFPIGGGVVLTGHKPTGNWVYLQVVAPDGAVIDAFWGFGPPANFKSGEGFALLDQYLAGKGRACDTPNRQGLERHGVSAGFCTGSDL